MIFFSFILTTFMLVAGCVNVDQLINEIHDADTETTFLYNTFSQDYDAYVEAQDLSDTPEKARTVLSLNEKALNSSQETSRSIDSLLLKISELQERRLNEKQEQYLEKLKLALENYKIDIDTRNQLLRELRVFDEYMLHNNLMAQHLVDFLNADNKVALHSSTENWEAASQEAMNMDKLLTNFESEVEQMQGIIPFKFLVGYEQFAKLSRAYVTQLNDITSKLVAKRKVLENEFTDLHEKGTVAGSTLLFKGEIIYVKGEEDELELYKKEHFQPQQQKAVLAYNKADAYYQDAKLKYERLFS